MNNNHHEKRPSLFWAFILIAVGVAFLFQNLGILSGSIWSNIFRFWPVLFILLGINDLLRNHVIVGPVLTIGLGIVFMTNNLSLIGLSSWFALARLWPVLIIAIGFEIFLGRKNVWLSAIGVGASLSLLVAGLWFSGGVLGKESVIAPRSTSEIVSEHIEQSLEEAESAKVTINSSLGEFSINALSGSENFIEGEIYSVEQETIEQKYELSKGEISYLLSSDWEPDSPKSFSVFDKEHLSWDLFLTDEIPLNLDISFGVGESDIDLSNLQITELSLNIGVGQTRVELPKGEYQAYIEGGVGQTIIRLSDSEQIKLNVEGGVGEIVIYIPEDMAVKIYVDRGISGLTVPSGYTQNEDLYTSPNYDKGEDYLELHLEQGIGNIAIREK